MPDNLVYMFGKVSEAITLLVTHPGNIRKRVWDASNYIFMVQPESLPESLRADVIWIHQQMTRHPPQYSDESALKSTFRKTRNITAQKIAARILLLYTLMRSEIEAREDEVRRLSK